MKSLIDKNLAICMLVRNCEKTLPTLLPKLERLRCQWQNSRVYIVENNSTDKSRKYVTHYRNSTTGVVLDCFDDPTLDQKERIERLTVLRNRYLALVKREKHFEPDHLMVVDGDIDFDESNIASIVQSAPSNWASLSANGRYYISIFKRKFHVLYYDLFAFVPWDSTEYMLTEEQMLANRFPLQQQLRKNAYVPCQCAFGGLCFYQYNLVKNLEYTCEKNLRTTRFAHVCEHIPFTLRQHTKGIHYICQDLHVSYEQLSRKAYLSLLLHKLIKKVYKSCFSL